MAALLYIIMPVSCTGTISGFLKGGNGFNGREKFSQAAVGSKKFFGGSADAFVYGRFVERNPVTKKGGRGVLQTS